MSATNGITDGLDLIDPACYGERGQPHATWTALRRESPVHRCKPPGYPPFWAITKHADVCDISRRPDAFPNAPGIVVPRADQPIDRSEGIGAVRTLQIARRSQRALFGELARRLGFVELIGDPAWIRSSFVVGLKHLPIRYRIARETRAG